MLINDATKEKILETELAGDLFFGVWFNTTCNECGSVWHFAVIDEEDLAEPIVCDACGEDCELVVI